MKLFINAIIRALLFVAVLALPVESYAAGRTAWTAGNGVGYTWSALFNGTDFTGAQPTTGQCLLSTLTITNQTAQDQLMDVSVLQSIASSTIVAGANFTIWLAILEADGSTYGDGKLTAGTAGTPCPVWSPVAVIPLYAAATQTSLVGSAMGIVIPPGSFRVVMQNNSGFTLTVTTQTWDYRTYNINVNN